MASKRGGSVAAALGRRFVATMEQGSRVKHCSESKRRAVSSSSWKLPQLDNVEPGLMTSVSTWRQQDQHPMRREEGGLPWALQGIQRQQPVLLSEEEDLAMTVAETRKILRHVNVVALQKRLQSDPRDSFAYRELVDFIKESNKLVSDMEAMRFARILDAAGVVLIFRENVYIHPERVAKLVAHALPFAVIPQTDPRRVELMQLEEQKAEIDALAWKQVRRYLVTGLVWLTCVSAFFVRLTYWELGWSVMEPIAFFKTSGYLILGYTYFLFTAKDPSYRNLMHCLFRWRQKKLFKKKKFDNLRYHLLRRKCQSLDPDEPQ